MAQSPLQIIETVILYAVPVILAVTLHEAAHGYVARFFGDDTAEKAGRISLNPLRHVDPVGTIILPALLLLANTGFIFGYAKPVPVNFGNLRHPKRDMFWVAGAGPFANFVMAVAWAFLLKSAAPGGMIDSDGLFEMAKAGIDVNLVLMALNLLPFPPLDGGRIALSLLPGPLAYRYSRLEPYGFMVVIALLATGVLSYLMQPILRAGEYVIRLLLGLG